MTINCADFVREVIDVRLIDGLEEYRKANFFDRRLPYLDVRRIQVSGQKKEEPIGCDFRIVSKY